MPSPPSNKKTRPSGPTIQESRRAERGQARLTLRVSSEVRALISRLAELSGHTAAEIVSRAVARFARDFPGEK